ncbi:hypothetical protein [Pseudomonas batumici]|uniref:hypothetical protein n=1 Tax=Pseudomonas batumici TaxID=226910 RepID=UPI003BB10B94
MKDPFSTSGREKAPVNATIAARLELLKSHAFVGADEVSIQHLEFFSESPSGL